MVAFLYLTRSSIVIHPNALNNGSLGYVAGLSKIMRAARFCSF
jgi:hypothetical protein